MAKAELEKSLLRESYISAVCGPGEYIAVNVGGLDDTLFSDTLFGHKKGAYTGASDERKGLIEKAKKGTLFLDEIGELENSSQIKLLRLLQENEYYPIGSDNTKMTNTRMIVATNIDLNHKIRTGEFRKDLYYRLNTDFIYLPPLKERMDDLSLLIDYFIKDACCILEKGMPKIPDELYALLSKYHFPGNIRELQSIIFNAVSINQSSILTSEYFENYINIKSGSLNEENSKSVKRINYSEPFPKMDEIEYYFFTEALIKAKGNQSITAQLLGISQLH